MIFSGGLAEKVLAGEKTQTRRPAKDDLPCRYREGGTYAVQEGRGRKAVGRIRVLAIRRVPVGLLSRQDAIAEGFGSIAEFYERWRELHGSFGGWCWAIEFELAEMPGAE